MDNSGDHTRALLLTLIMLIMLLMIQIDSIQSDAVDEAVVECPTSPSPPCAMDCNGNILFYDKDKGSCQQCPKCGPGLGLDSHCGGEDGQLAKCETCSPGMTFTRPNDYWCRPCRLCGNTVGDTPCNITTDAVCGKCRTGYYHEKGKPDQCHPCEFLPQPELEPQCQIPQKTTTDPPQEGSEVSTTDAAVLAPTLSDENTSPPQETNYVSPSPASGDLADPVDPSTGSLSPEEFEAGESPGSGDLAEDEQVFDEPVPSSSNHVLNATLGIGVTVLTILMVTLMYKCLKKRIPHRATHQQSPQTDYAVVNVEDSEDSVEVDVHAQTAIYRAKQHAMAGELSGNRGGLSHVGSADSVSRSSANLLGSTSYSDPHLRHLPSDAIMPDDDERDEMITAPINTAAHSSTSCSGPENASDDVKATSFEVLPKKPDFQLGGEPLVFPAKQGPSSGNNIISPSGRLPGRASNIGTQHPTTEGWNMGVDCRPSMVSSAYPDGNGRVADPEVTLCKENEFDTVKVSTFQAASTIAGTDVAVSSAAVVVDVTAASLPPSPSPADTHADAALATTDDSTTAAAATAAGAVAVAANSPDKTDGAAYLAEIESTPNPASGLINKDTGAVPESNCSSPLIKSATSKKSRRSKVRVAPSDLDSSNGSKEHSAASSSGPCIHVNVNGSSNRVYVGNNSNLNIGYNSTDTESDE